MNRQAYDAQHCLSISFGRFCCSLCVLMARLPAQWPWQAGQDIPLIDPATKIPDRSEAPCVNSPMGLECACEGGAAVPILIGTQLSSTAFPGHRASMNPALTATSITSALCCMKVVSNDSSSVLGNDGTSRSNRRMRRCNRLMAL